MLICHVTTADTTQYWLYYPPTIIIMSIIGHKFGENDEDVFIIASTILKLLETKMGECNEIFQTLN